MKPESPRATSRPAISSSPPLADQLERLREALAVQQAAGYTAARELSASEVLEHNPHLAPEGILGGTFSHVDGFL